VRRRETHAETATETSRPASTPVLPAALVLVAACWCRCRCPADSAGPSVFAVAGGRVDGGPLRFAEPPALR